jgi:YD repeat-containing protein
MTIFRISLLILASIPFGAVFADSVNYTYDQSGRLTSATYMNGTVISYVYDASGNLTARNVIQNAGSVQIVHNNWAKVEASAEADRSPRRRKPDPKVARRLADK